MGRSERKAAKGDDQAKAPEVRRTKTTLAMDDEIVWRLGVYARMLRVGPGELVEKWIRPHLKSVRLPYETYGRQPDEGPKGPTEPAANPGEEASDAGQVVPIGEPVSPPGGDPAAEGPGQGRGEARGKRRAS